MDYNEHFGAPCCLCLLPWRRRQQTALTSYELSTRRCGAEHLSPCISHNVYRRPEIYYCFKQEEKLELTFSSVFYPVLPVKSIDVQVKIRFYLKCFLTRQKVPLKTSFYMSSITSLHLNGNACVLTIRLPAQQICLSYRSRDGAAFHFYL